MVMVTVMSALRLSGSRNHNHPLPLLPPLLLLLPVGSCFGPVRDTFDVPA
jgi:hypothetical protein